MTIWIISAIIISYLVGSVHGSKIAQFFSGINVKNEGLKNSGASNAAIVLGLKYGILVAMIDILKGVFIVIGFRYATQHFATFTEAEQAMILYLAGAAVILGHNFPIFTRFKGGKGTASIIGILLAINWPIGLIGFLLLVVTTLLTDYLLIGVFVFYFVFIASSIWFAAGSAPVIIACFLFIMASLLHIENFKRLFRNEEMKISTFLKRKKPAA
ncbi:glycerol-3-phosphate acyltransferase [Psychrobacillus sp.]|uniref:glycerol-3-phosphate acyltransferase n=1 Tax=Psychrobacillus sp. TaxID=1871623 RepID=UPI0028BE54C1|nr:glycerol-3-phosphate acyltransferase [Psychrobacillus sp.]